MIEAIKVQKRYFNNKKIFTALDAVDLTVEKGDHILVSGPSGSGKSTLLHVLGGLVQPDAGSVLFSKKELYTLTPKELNDYRKRKIGFVFQQFHLMPYLSILENIQLSCHEKKHFGRIDYFLEMCSLTELKDKYPFSLSVGEKQRAAFIRAVISDPEILLADEPTGNLDTVNSNILMELIGDFHKKGGTVIMVSHNPAMAKYAGKIAVLEKGRIVSWRESYP